MSEPDSEAVAPGIEWAAVIAQLEEDDRKREEENRRTEAMRTAAYEGRSERVRELLAAGWSLNHPEYGGSEALYWAVAGSQLDLIHELLALGADLEVNSTHQRTALARAARMTLPHPLRQPDRRPLDLLLAAGARLRLHEAVLLNDLPLARNLLEQGADPNFGVGEYFGPVLMDAGKQGFAEMVDLLLGFGADVDGVDDLYHRPLMNAAAGGHFEVVRRLLARGAALDSNWPHDTALSNAIQGGHLDLYHWLLDQGAKRGPIDAVIAGDLAWLDQYLDSQSEREFRYDNLLNGVRSVTEIAVEHGQVAIVRTLLARGAKLSDQYGRGSLLIYAAQYGQLEVIRLLLDHGADLHQADHEGLTPLAWALQQNQIEATDLLRRAGATR